MYICVYLYTHICTYIYIYTYACIYNTHTNNININNSAAVEAEHITFETMCWHITERLKRQNGKQETEKNRRDAKTVTSGSVSL